MEQQLFCFPRGFVMIILRHEQRLRMTEHPLRTDRVRRSGTMNEIVKEAQDVSSASPWRQESITLSEFGSRQTAEVVARGVDGVG